MAVKLPMQGSREPSNIYFSMCRGKHPDILEYFIWMIIMIRKILILVVMFVLVSGLASADPSIKFDNLTVDLGEITEGVKISTEFKFTNVGDKTLERLEVRNWRLEVG
jgi:hypothetical protein